MMYSGWRLSTFQCPLEVLDADGIGRIERAEAEYMLWPVLRAVTSSTLIGEKLGAMP